MWVLVMGLARHYTATGYPRPPPTLYVFSVHREIAREKGEEPPQAPRGDYRLMASLCPVGCFF